MSDQTLIPATSAARFTIWVFGGYAIWQGMGIVAGGVGRWTSPSFSVLKTIPHPTDFWGCFLFLAGCVILFGSLSRLWWAKMIGLIGLVIWSLLFAIGSLHAASKTPTMANTGGKTYILIAVVAVVLIFIDERKPRDA